MSNINVETECLGTALNGKRYKSLFNDGEFSVVLADFVSTSEGTGIVHIAPAFGEDDFNVAKAEGLPLVTR